MLSPSNISEPQSSRLSPLHYIRQLNRTTMYTTENQPTATNTGSVASIQHENGAIPKTRLQAPNKKGNINSNLSKVNEANTSVQNPAALQHHSIAKSNQLNIPGGAAAQIDQRMLPDRRSTAFWEEFPSRNAEQEDVRNESILNAMANPFNPARNGAQNGWNKLSAINAESRNVQNENTNINRSTRNNYEEQQYRPLFRRPFQQLHPIRSEANALNNNENNRDAEPASDEEIDDWLKTQRDLLNDFISRRQSGVRKDDTEKELLKALTNLRNFPPGRLTEDEKSNSSSIHQMDEQRPKLQLSRDLLQLTIDKYNIKGSTKIGRMKPKKSPT